MGTVEAAEAAYQKALADGGTSVDWDYQIAGHSVDTSAGRSFTVKVQAQDIAFGLTKGSNWLTRHAADLTTEHVRKHCIPNDEIYEVRQAFDNAIDKARLYVRGVENSIRLAALAAGAAVDALRAGNLDKAVEHSDEAVNLEVSSGIPNHHCVWRKFADVVGRLAGELI